MPDITMKRERTDRWTKMRLSRARSSGTAASCHMLSSVDCITTTSESKFSVHTGIHMLPGRDRTAWLRWSDSNSEMSSQIIPLKDRADCGNPPEFWPQRLFAFDLRRWADAARV